MLHGPPGLSQPLLRHEYYRQQRNREKIWNLNEMIGCTNHFKLSHEKAIKIAIRGRSLAVLLVTKIITFKNSI